MQRRGADPDMATSERRDPGLAGAIEKDKRATGTSVVRMLCNCGKRQLAGGLAAFVIV